MMKKPLIPIKTSSMISFIPNWDKIINGMNFWIVKTRNTSNRLILKMIPIIHLWKGGTPSLKMIEAMAIIDKNLIESISSIENKKLTEAALWEIKYFTPHIIESWVELPKSTGMMQSMFTSRQTHCKNSLSTLKAPTMQPKIIDI